MSELNIDIEKAILFLLQEKYFAEFKINDYKGGSVSIVDNETGISVYETEVFLFIKPAFKRVFFCFLFYRKN